MAPGEDGGGMTDSTTLFLHHSGATLPLIGGPMYPCSNPELVAAVSETGAIGVVQPMSLTYVHSWKFREGLRFIRSLTHRPIGMNVLIEGRSKTYRRRMEEWITIALGEGIRFFITSLGNPRWVVERVQSEGGVVYHDVTEAKWAEKGLAGGATGLIAVNRRAGGHAGGLAADELLKELGKFRVPVVAAGGVGNAAEFGELLEMGYAAVQCGTRFIATTECSASLAYKRAILAAGERDIVMSERLTGVPVAVINTPLIQRMGTHAGPLARFLLRGRRTKHWMRSFYALRSLRSLKQGLTGTSGHAEYWQAGRSVETIDAIEPVATVVARFREAWLKAPPLPPPGNQAHT